MKLVVPKAMVDLRDKLGRPIKDLRVSITDRCNFRCPYCMPKEVFGERYKFLSKPQILTFEEIARMVRIFVGLGVTKIRLTGGEPLVRQGLEDLVAMISEINGIEDLTLTTNGYLLDQKAQLLKDAGLHRITVSLDSLDDAIFREMSGRNYGSDRVLAGIKKAKEVGFSPIKINAVVRRGVNDNTIMELARHFKGTNDIVRFIEYMDVGNLNGWRWDEVVPAEELRQRINQEIPIEPIGKNYPGEVAKRYRYMDGKGEIGIITSVSKPFCGDCTRARLSTDGKLYTCLFASVGTDLREPIRNDASDEEVKSIITAIWGRRVDRYSEERAFRNEEPSQKIEMYQIGG